MTGRLRVKALLQGTVGSVLFLLASACGKEAAPTGAVTRADSAGVEIVINRVPDRPLGWSLDSVLTLRSPTGTGGDTVGFFGVTDVAITDGRVVVLDRSIPALVVYDSLGRVRGRYGRKGQGPGEFEYPVAMAAAPDGGVAVFDMANGRIEHFDSSFAPTGATSLLSVRVRPGAMRFAGNAAVLSTSRTAGDTAVLGLDALGPRDTTVIATLRQHRNAKFFTAKSCGFDFPPGVIAPAFAPTLRWAVDRRGRVVVATDDRYDIGVYGGPHFSLERRIRRDEPPLRATKALAVKSLGRDLNGCDPEELVERAGFAPTVPPLGDMLVAPDGDLWVHRWVPQGDSLIDVFDSTGVYRGTLRGQPMPTAFLDDDRVIVTRTDAMDVTLLTIYRLRR